LGELRDRLLDRLELHAQNPPVLGTETGAHVSDVAEVAGRVVCAECQCPEPAAGLDPSRTR
jgi:uncharacterized phage protein gp47/JayE